MRTDTATPPERAGRPPTTGDVDVRLVPALVPPPRRRAPGRDGTGPPPAPPVLPVLAAAEGAELCGPAVERLGAARLASYHHPAPGAAPALSRATAPPLPPGTVPGSAAHLDPRQACCMVALAAVEVLAGRRPLAQLARWLMPDVYDALGRRAALTAPGSRVLDATAGRDDLRRDGRPRAAGERPGAGRRASVRRVRVHRVDAHVVESSVVVAHGDRVRAVAVRLTRASGWWRASALVVG
jgi:hypothetical protein